MEGGVIYKSLNVFVFSVVLLDPTLLIRDYFLQTIDIERLECFKSFNQRFKTQRLDFLCDFAKDSVYLSFFDIFTFFEIFL